MAKEIKGKERSSRRQYMKVDNIKHKVTKQNERKSAKSPTENKHHNPSQEKSSKEEHRERREPRPEKQNITMTSTELLHPISGGIIKSGIQYIMFPLHFLRFCLFGTNSISEKLAVCEVGKGSKNSESSGKKTNKEEKENISSKSRDDRQAKNDEASNRRSSEESLKNTRSGSSTDTRNAGSSRAKDSKEVRKGHDEGLVERPLVVLVEEDSDSSSDRWSTASSTMIEDVSMDIDRSISFDSLVEPMDISMEDTHDRLQIVMGSREKQNTTLSLDSEMARIFQKQCTSSDDEYSSSNTMPEKGERPGGKNFLWHARTSHSAATVPLKSKEEGVNKEQKKKTSSEEVDKERKKKTSEEVDKERKKKTSEEVDKERKKKISSEEVDKERKKKISSEDVTHHKRRKVSQEEDRPEKQRDGKSDAKRREEKQPSKLDTRNNSKTRSPKSPVKSKESKRKDVKYKETATQTDSAFSDDDVEMIPVDAKLPEKRYCCKHALYRSHPNLTGNTTRIM
ncbi:uncharacterized protein LOC143208613 isoform X2 [Lasioglossum baleicum]|uniref:uncharacterized protein LOC143208613 isoform X2 n=1 Tax=Lasioglossum baleicum TaxID=434251 RepID=UPI003FCECA49